MIRVMWNINNALVLVKVLAIRWKQWWPLPSVVICVAGPPEFIANSYYALCKSNLLVPLCKSLFDRNLFGVSNIIVNS